jgi:putative redox protein
MQVKLNRKNEAFHFEAIGASNVKVNLDASPDIGGINAGARPMELLLMGLGGCTAIDILLILKKQRQVVEDIQIVIDGERHQLEGTEMTPFKTINLHYILKGNISEDKLIKAIDLSMEKYCSATAQFNQSAKITYTFELI